MKLKRKLFHWFLDHYKKSKQRKNITASDQALSLAKKAIAANKYAFFITNDDGKSPNARLIEPVVDLENLVFWIGTNPKLRKVAEVKKNAAVTLAFSNEKANSNVIIQGSASIEKNPELARKHWKPQWRLFFPKGPESNDFVLIKVVAESLEVLDFSRNIVPEPFGLKPMRITGLDKKES